MNTLGSDPAAVSSFELADVRFVLDPDGALFAPDAGALIVADLHLGRSERTARIGGALLPPYETTDTLERLRRAIDRRAPDVVVCLGDSFDDRRAAERLRDDERAAITAMTGERDWIWVSGNHDPSPPPALGGRAAKSVRLGSVVLRHIATPGERYEISGHHHPKAALDLGGRTLRRRCLLRDGRRAIVPAFGLYTGGLDVGDPAFDPLFGPDAVAVLLPAQSEGRVLAAPRSRLSRDAAQRSVARRGAGR